MRHRLYAEDADRAPLALEALCAALAQDPRVQAAYLAWSKAVRQAFTRGRAQQPAAPAAALFASALYLGVSDDLDRLERLVRKTLGLPYAWLAETLLFIFRVRLIDETCGEGLDVRVEIPAPTIAAEAEEAPRVTVVRLHRRSTMRKAPLLVAFARRVVQPADAPAPRRRRPKNRGSHIPRDVRWFYRAEIKRPKDKITAIAQEYVASMRHLGEKADERSVVRAGIHRAKRILASIVLVPPSLAE